MTVVAQLAKAQGIHGYVAGSIPAVTPRYCTKKIEKCSLEHKKTKKNKKLLSLCRGLYSGRQKYSARSAKVAHLLRAITTVPDKIERSSFFYLKDLGGLYTCSKFDLNSYKTFLGTFN